MSIVACVNVHDAIVFGSDSMTTISRTDKDGKTTAIQSYQHAQKLHKLSDQIAVATWGAGNIGSRSIGNIIAQFARQNDDAIREQSVKATATELLSHIRRIYDNESGSGRGPILGAMVGGYSPNSELAEILEFKLPASNSTPQRVREMDEFGASWRGVSGPFSRLYAGFDPRMLKLILDSVGEHGDKVRSISEKFKSPFVFDGMPIQEAIDFVVFVLQTTTNVAKFEMGLSSCGGPLWVSVIAKDGFKWICKPSLTVKEAS